MQKLISFLIMAVLMISFVIAADLDVKVLDKNPVIIIEESNFAGFTLSITNNEAITDDFEIYSLVGIEIFPKEFFRIVGNATKELEIEIAPRKEVLRDIRGAYNFEYEIKGKQTGFYKDILSIRIVELKNVIDVKPENINLEDSQATITITNLEDVDLENVSITAKSFFFEFSETVDLSSKEAREFTVTIQKEKIGRLFAGEYDVDLTFELNEQKSKKTANVKYLEKGGVSVSATTSGLIIREKTIAKKNEGNIDSITTITDKKDIFSRLFTTYSKTPLTTERKGPFVEYTWEKELSPGDQLTIRTTTNYTFPFILIIIVILVILIAKVFMIRDLTLQKRVSLMKTRGGEFALKVKLRTKARKSLENIRIIDKLPRLTKLYEKFGSKPDKIDPKTRRILWHIKKLNAGEERVFTYIIYSKINIIGKFELPAASAKFERKDGKHDEVHSNKAYFAAETSEDAEED
jgi:hypothetical protein